MIMKQGPSLPDILKIMQTTLKTIDNWCKENRLKISKDKSALMPVFTKNKEVLKSHPTIIERGIKIVSQMKYLGVTLDCKLDWYPHTVPGKHGAAFPKQPCPLLNSHVGFDIPQPDDDS